MKKNEDAPLKDTLAISIDYKYLLPDNAELRRANKVDDMLYLLTHRHLIVYHLQSIKHAAVPLVENTVGMTNVFDDFCIHTLVREDVGVHTVVICRLFGCDDVRRQIFAEAAARLRHRPCTYAAALAHQDVSSEDYAILEEAVAGDFAPVAEHAMVADMRVVRDMHTLVQEVSVADEGLPAGACGTVDDNILAYDIVVANDNGSLVACLIVEVLRLCRNDSTVEHSVVFPQTSTAHNAGVRHNLAIVANLDVLVDICKRMNRHILSEFCTGIYIS